MTPARLSLPLAAALAAYALPASAAPSQPLQAELRLFDGGEADGERFAGLEIVLPRETLTYWRHPGEAGIPPSFDFARSKNLAAAAPLYPAPAKLDEAGSTVFGYTGRVVFPIRIEPADRGKPVELALDLDYAICEKICIPAKASLTAIVRPGAAAEPEVARALAAVPQRQARDASGPLSITGATAVAPPPRSLAAWRVTARLPGPAQLFAEAPEGYWIEAEDPAPGAAPDFLLRLVEAPKARARTLPVRLTLVSGDRAVETTLDLDLQGSAP